jgi:hypothetical protein
MVKKSIAAALLVAMVAWAEMALAPMLAMPAHMLPGIDSVEHAAMHNHAMPAGHPCCPKISTTNNSEEQAPVEFDSSRLPYQDEHRCCFRQGPQSVPAPVSAQQRLTQATASAETAVIRLAGGSDSRVLSEVDFALGPPPSTMGMVLRV